MKLMRALPMVNKVGYFFDFFFLSATMEALCQVVKIRQSVSESKTVHAHCQGMVYHIYCPH